METSFKTTFAVLWILYFIARLFFQRRVRKNLEYTRINERREILLFRVFALAFILLPLYFLTSWIDFASLPLSTDIRWVGAIVTFIGLLLFCWAHGALGQNWTAVLALSNEHELVQSGPYRLVRHPMYSAFFVIGIGFGLLSANWLIGVIYLVPLFVMYEARVSAEEQMMIVRFGDTYREYMKYTGRLWPRL